MLYFGPDSTGQLNFNLDFQGTGDAAGKNRQRRGAIGASAGTNGARKKGGSGQPRSTINVAILPPGGGPGKAIPLMVDPGGMHAPLAPWPGYPYAIHGNQTVVVERPGIPGASSSSSSKTVLSRFPQVTTIHVIILFPYRIFRVENGVYKSQRFL